MYSCLTKPPEYIYNHTWQSAQVTLSLATLSRCSSITSEQVRPMRQLSPGQASREDQSGSSTWTSFQVANLSIKANVKLQESNFTTFRTFTLLHLCNCIVNCNILEIILCENKGTFKFQQIVLILVSLAIISQAE